VDLETSQTLRVLPGFVSDVLIELQTSPERFKKRVAVEQSFKIEDGNEGVARVILFHILLSFGDL
jgi:hypothetical protein